MNIFCTGNTKKHNFFKILKDIIDLNNLFNHNLYFDDKIDFNISEDYFKEKYLPFILKNNRIISFNNEILDFVISAGGDGSLLSIIRSMHTKQIPVLGIHIGNLGFLNQANINNYKEILNEVFSTDSFDVLHYNLITAHIDNRKNKTSDFEFIALNDIVIKHADLLRLITLDIHIDNEHLNSYACDGMIFSTPIGSTAYSLSAGGPIVLHEINSIIITPISAHSLSARPIIVSGEKSISIKFPQYTKSINIVSDGQVQKYINSNSLVKVQISDIKSKFIITNKMESYYSKLKSKIGWFGSSHK